MKSGFLRSTSIVGAMTLLSRVTGLIRDVVYAHLFGAGLFMDAFQMAFRIPNFLRRITGEGAFSQAFVPVVAEYRLREDAQAMRRLVAGVTGRLGLVLLVLTGIGVIGAPVVIVMFAPGFGVESPRHDLAVEMLRWTFPYIFFISLTALGSGVLNAYGKFGTAAFNPVLLNLVMIGFAALIAPHSSSPGVVLAIGVFVAGIIQFVAQFRGLARLGVLTWPQWSAPDEGVGRVARLMLPGIFGSSVAQISLLIGSWVASFLMTGSISWMYYADRLVEFPMGVFSIALATVILPGLSAHHVERSPERFSATLDWAMRLTTIVTVPATLGLVLLAGPLTATIYGHGQFVARDVVMGGYALMGAAFGLLGYSLVKVLAPGFYARQDTRTPVRVGLIALCVTMAFNLVVVVPANYLGFPAPHALLALSPGLGAYVNVWMLHRRLTARGVLVPSAHWAALLTRQLPLANGAMAAFLWLASGEWVRWTGAPSWVQIGRLGVCVGGGGLIYAGVLWLTGIRPKDLRAV
jgi:putative peptidoglycan lipid II flippase